MIINMEDKLLRKILGEVLASIEEELYHASQEYSALKHTVEQYQRTMLSMEEASEALEKRHSDILRLLGEEYAH